MARYLILCILITGLQIYINAQSFTWIDGEETGYEMNPGMVRYAVCTGPDNTVWFAGMKQKKTAYYAMMGDLFLIHYDQQGNRMDEYFVNGSATVNAVESDQDGNIYIAGDFINENIELWDGTVLEWDGNSINAFLLKVNAQDSVEWAKNLNITQGNYSPVSDMIFKNNQLYVAHSVWLACNISIVDDLGNLTPVIIETEVGIISGLDVDSEGNIYVAGSCAGLQNQFNGVNFPSPFAYDKHLVKYDPNGYPVWIRFVEDITCVFSKVKVDQEDNVYWAGPLHNACIFDTIPLEGPGWLYDLFLVKFNSQGDALWAKEVPQSSSGDAMTGEIDFIRVLPDNSVALSGISRGMVDWGNGVVTNVEIGSRQALILNFDSFGLAKWAKTGYSSYYTSAQYIDTDAEGNLYMTGLGHDTTRFDDQWIFLDTYYYPYLVRLETGLNTGVQDPRNSGHQTACPNPTDGLVFITVHNPQSQDVLLEIYDLQGRKVAESTHRPMSKAGQTIEYDLSGLVPGTYLYRYSTGNQMATGKIVKR